MIKEKNRFGFSFLEMLISIGILIVLVAVTVIVINPMEYLKQSRDSNRISDLTDINLFFSKYKYSGQRIDSLGNVNVVYVSLPSNLSDCSDLGLPTLVSGWNYRCATETNYRKTDGTGWLPIDLTVVSGGYGISALPVDPTNLVAGGVYYAYIIDSSLKFEIISSLESQKNIDKYAVGDGGIDDTKVEKGENLLLWKEAMGL